MNKILIISAHCLSHHDANGRSLLNILGGFSAEQLFQFSTVSEPINEKLCESYLQITDKNAFLGFFGKRFVEKKFSDEFVNNNTQIQQKNFASPKIKKNAFTMLLRDFIWNHNIGVKLSLKKWIEIIKPDVAILQLGDSSSLVNIAISVIKALNIPLIIYNTEDYYFKKYDYMKKTFSSGFVYKIFNYNYRNSIKKMFRYSPTVISNCEGIKKLFDDEFGVPSYVLYNSSDMDFQENTYNRTSGSIVYAGNLGVGRHKSLIEIGEILHTIDKNLYLDVFGNAPNQEIANELSDAKNIRYHGWVDYQTVQKIIYESRLLIHTESFDEYQKLDTRYAFSTKIADYCASGIPMLFYAPRTSEGFGYIEKEKSAFLVSSKESLYETLNNALFDFEMRKKILNNAKKMVEINHNIKSNQDFMCKLVKSIIKERANEY